MKTIEKKTNRIYWMDNLRSVIIFLVVLYHVGGVYEAAGMWGSFWIVDDPATISWVGIVGIAFDIFIMPAMFFIAGYLTPISLERKGAGGFVKSKLKRLMLPWLLAVLTLIPLYKVIFLYSRDLPQENWTTYFHFNNPNSQNWLWFLPLLFVFNLIYLLLVKLNVRFDKFSIKWAVAGTFVISVTYSMVMGNWLGFRSWTLTPLLDFENEKILTYFMYFLVGVLAFRQNIFSELPKKKTLYTIANAVVWLPVTVHIFARIWPFFYPNPAEFEITPLFRLIWWISFHSGAIGMVYLMVESFWRYVDRSGKLWGTLSHNSYGVYIIHVIMIGIFGTLLLNANLTALVKYPLLIISTYVGSNLLVSAYYVVKQSLRQNRNQ
ncbi:MAG: acyltransferase family protein [Anaerolineaceae bacterium]|nr:acyltransferase family protein [Anaerolineaceae bacterium]